MTCSMRCSFLWRPGCRIRFPFHWGGPLALSITWSSPLIFNGLPPIETFFCCDHEDPLSAASQVRGARMLAPREFRIVGSDGKRERPLLMRDFMACASNDRLSEAHGKHIAPSPSDRAPSSGIGLQLLFLCVLRMSSRANLPLASICPSASATKPPAPLPTVGKVTGFIILCGEFRPPAPVATDFDSPPPPPAPPCELAQGT